MSGKLKSRLIGWAVVFSLLLTLLVPGVKTYAEPGGDPNSPPEIVSAVLNVNILEEKAASPEHKLIIVAGDNQFSYPLTKADEKALEGSSSAVRRYTAQMNKEDFQKLTENHSAPEFYLDVKDDMHALGQGNPDFSDTPEGRKITLNFYVHFKVRVMMKTPDPEVDFIGLLLAGPQPQHVYFEKAEVSGENTIYVGSVPAWDPSEPAGIDFPPSVSEDSFVSVGNNEQKIIKTQEWNAEKKVLKITLQDAATLLVRLPEEFSLSDSNDYQEGFLRINYEKNGKQYLAVSRKLIHLYKKNEQDPGTPLVEFFTNMPDTLMTKDFSLVGALLFNHNVESYLVKQASWEEGDEHSQNKAYIHVAEIEPRINFSARFTDLKSAVRRSSFLVPVIKLHPSIAPYVKLENGTETYTSQIDEAHEDQATFMGLSYGKYTMVLDWASLSKNPEFFNLVSSYYPPKDPDADGKVRFTVELVRGDHGETITYVDGIDSFGYAKGHTPTQPGTGNPGGFDIEPVPLPARGFHAVSLIVLPERESIELNILSNNDILKQSKVKSGETVTCAVTILVPASRSIRLERTVTGEEGTAYVSPAYPFNYRGPKLRFEDLLDSRFTDVTLLKDSEFEYIGYPLTPPDYIMPQPTPGPGISTPDFVPCPEKDKTGFFGENGLKQSGNRLYVDSLEVNPYNADIAVVVPKAEIEGSSYFAPILRDRKLVFRFTAKYIGPDTDKLLLDEAIIGIGKTDKQIDRPDWRFAQTPTDIADYRFDRVDFLVDAPTTTLDVSKVWNLPAGRTGKADFELVRTVDNPTAVTEPEKYAFKEGESTTLFKWTYKDTSVTPVKEEPKEAKVVYDEKTKLHHIIDLPYRDENGHLYHYAVKETGATVSGYTAADIKNKMKTETERKEATLDSPLTFVFTNSLTDKPTPPDRPPYTPPDNPPYIPDIPVTPEQPEKPKDEVPKTGEHASAASLALVLLGAAAVLALARRQLAQKNK